MLLLTINQSLLAFNHPMLLIYKLIELLPQNWKETKRNNLPH